MELNIPGTNNYEDMFNNAVEGGVKYLKAYPNIRSFIIGISGGIDSALVCALARAAIDKIDRKIDLIGYSLPLLTNKRDEVDRASNIGASYCDFFTEVDLHKAYMGLIQPIDNSLFYDMYGYKPNKSHASRIRAGNLKARLRMTFLYDKASKYEGLVLSTDNYTEYLLGFWTLHGDVGDFGFIQNLWKTEVYELAEWRGIYTCCGALLECVSAIPTDGLGVSDSDLDQLLPDWTISHRKGYEFIDKILVALVNKDEYIDAGGETGKLPLLSLQHPVVKRYLATEFKRNNPVSLTRAQLIRG
jgi:NAD+ synthase